MWIGEQLTTSPWCGSAAFFLPRASNPSARPLFPSGRAASGGGVRINSPCVERSLSVGIEESLTTLLRHSRHRLPSLCRWPRSRAHPESWEREIGEFPSDLQRIQPIFLVMSRKAVPLRTDVRVSGSHPFLAIHGKVDWLFFRLLFEWVGPHRRTSPLARDLIYSPFFASSHTWQAQNFRPRR